MNNFILKDRLDYLKRRISPLIKVDPPYYWEKMNLHITGDSFVGLEFESLRVHVVQEDVPPKIACGALISGEEYAKDLKWDYEQKNIG